MRNENFAKLIGNFRSRIFGVLKWKRGMKKNGDHVKIHTHTHKSLAQYNTHTYRVAVFACELICSCQIQLLFSLIRFFFRFPFIITLQMKQIRNKINWLFDSRCRPPAIYILYHIHVIRLDWRTRPTFMLPYDFVSVVSFFPSFGGTAIPKNRIHRNFPALRIFIDFSRTIVFKRNFTRYCCWFSTEIMFIHCWMLCSGICLVLGCSKFFSNHFISLQLHHEPI